MSANTKKEQQFIDAVVNNDYKTVKEFFEEKDELEYDEDHLDKNVHLTIKDSSSEYHFAPVLSVVNTLKMAKLLVKLGVDIDHSSHHGDFKTAFYYIENSEIVKYLIKQSANIDYENVYGETALFTMSHNEEVAKIFIENGADINYKNTNGYTPLMTAITEQVADAVKILLKFEADTEVKNNYDQTALDIAKQTNNTEIIDILQAHINEKKLEKNINNIVDEVVFSI